MERRFNKNNESKLKRFVRKIDGGEIIIPLYIQPLHLYYPARWPEAGWEVL